MSDTPVTKPITMSKPMSTPKKTALSALGDDKAKVRETKVIEYVTDKPNEEQDNNEINGQGDTNNFEGPTINYPNQKETPKNRLADIFMELKDIEEQEGEVFYAMVTRRPDLMNDNFRRKCMTAETFPPLQITSNMMMQFLSDIQRYNENSGGRFDIVILDTAYQDTEVGVSGLTIPNPLLEEKKVEEEKTSSDLKLILEHMAKQQLDFQTTIKELLLQPQKEDDFVALAKEKMRNDILNPKTAPTVDVAGIIQQIMVVPAVVSAMGEGFKGMFANNAQPEKTPSTMEMLLGNEMFMDKATGIVENLIDNVSSIAEVAVSNRQPVSNGMPQQPQWQGNNANPLPNAPVENEVIEVEQEIPIEVSQAQMAQQKIVHDILTELESDNALDENNVFFNQMKADNPDIYELLKGMCNLMTFDNAMLRLEQLAPDEFRRYAKEDNPQELSELGIKIQGKLKNLYDFLRKPETPKKVAVKKNVIKQ